MVRSCQIDCKGGIADDKMITSFKFKRTDDDKGLELNSTADGAQLSNEI